MKDKNAIEKFVDRAMEDDDFQDVADVIEKAWKAPSITRRWVPAH